MNKIELTYSPYKLNLTKPFETSKNIISERKGFLIQLRSSLGKVGIGDAAPLPELGSEKFEDDEAALKNIKLKFKLDLALIESNISQILSPYEKLPALKHGIEQALINLICKEKKYSLNELFNKTSRKEIKVNAVIGFLTPNESAKTASELISEGFQTIKVKVGRKLFDEDLKCLKEIRKAVGNKIKIRIDVNGKWKLSEAVNNLEKLKSLDLEYIEQPVKSLKDFIELSKMTSIPLAVDESIKNEKDAKNFILKKAASVLILKPMLLGGIIPTINIIRLAEENEIKVVISSSFESVIGRSMTIFAASIVKDEIAHGLATGIYFEKDLAADPYKVKNGKINLEIDKGF